MKNRTLPDFVTAFSDNITIKNILLSIDIKTITAVTPNNFRNFDNFGIFIVIYLFSNDTFACISLKNKHFSKESLYRSCEIILICTRRFMCHGLSCRYPTVNLKKFSRK